MRLLKVAVIGMGLIGTSVSLAARRAWPDVDLIEIDRGQPIEPAFAADTIVLAAPVDDIIEILRTHGPRFSGSLVTDVGSTKQAIVAAARELGMANFVGGHPMAGAASSGPGEARADLFDRKPWFLFAGTAAERAVAQARQFVEALGADPVVLDDDGREHDQVMAAVSHLPQIVASALMAVVGEATAARGLEWAGAGLRDTTRLAAGAAGTWESILSTNKAQIQPLLTTLAGRLHVLAGQLDDPQAIRTLFAAANEHRRRLIDARPEE